MISVAALFFNCLQTSNPKPSILIVASNYAKIYSFLLNHSHPIIIFSFQNACLLPGFLTPIKAPIIFHSHRYICPWVSETGAFTLHGKKYLIKFIKYFKSRGYKRSLYKEYHFITNIHDRMLKSYVEIKGVFNCDAFKKSIFFIALFDSKNEYAEIEEGVSYGPGIAD